MLFLKIPGCMEDGNLRLRPLRVSDGPFILRRLNDAAILKASGLSRPIESSWFFVWWWMKKTFTPAYCIECDSRPIGFIGLYNLIPGKSAEMSLTIFDDSFRRAGYGTRTFGLFVQNLKKRSIVKRIFFKVRADNSIALSFWRKLGAMETETSGEIITMSMDL